MVTAIHSIIKKKKSPGTDGLSVEFYLCFWDMIENLLFEMYTDTNEQSTSMKPGLITLLPKPDKDHLILDNWRPITLLNVDYKLFSYLCKSLKKKV